MNNHIRLDSVGQRQTAFGQIAVTEVIFKPKSSVVFAARNLTLLLRIWIIAATFLYCWWQLKYWKICPSLFFGFSTIPPYLSSCDKRSSQFRFDFKATEGDFGKLILTGPMRPLVRRSEHPEGSKERLSAQQGFWCLGYQVCWAFERFGFSCESWFH